MPIWYHQPNLEALNASRANTLLDVLDIRFEAIDDDFITASMVVDPRTHQPFGLLHGGASVVLAESLGSMASYHCIDPQRYHCVGLEVNANHLRSLREGRVTGVCRPVHLGRQTHVWDIRLCGEDGKTSCISRLTVAVLPLSGSSANEAVSAG